MSQIVLGGLLAPEVGDVATWDGREWVPSSICRVPGPPGPRGPGGGHGHAGPAGPAGPSGAGNLVSVGKFQRIPDIETTNSLVPVPYWDVPFTLSAPADVLFMMTAIVFEVGSGDPTDFMGFNFTSDVDGNPTLDLASWEFNLDDASVNTSVETSTYQIFVPGLAAGPHVLHIFWSVNDVDVTVLSGAGQANISIRDL